MNRRRVVAINRYFFPDDSATSQMLTDVATALAEDGYAVKVLTSRRQLERQEVLLPPRDQRAGVEIRRVWSTNFGRRILVGRALDYATFYAALILVLLWEISRGDLVVVMTDPPMLGTVAGFIGRVKGARMVNWHQDLYPEIAARLGVLRMESSPYKLLLRIRNWALRNAAANVVLGSRMAKHVETAEPLSGEVTLIPNWFEDVPAQTPPSAQNAYRRDLGLGASFVVGYAGNFGRAHDLDGVVQAASGLRDREDVHFLMIGSGARYEPLRKQVAAMSLPRWHFLPYQPRERAAEFLSAIDAHLVCLDPTVEGLVVPSKLYGVMAAGRPVLFYGSADSEVGEIVRRHDCGLTAATADELRAAMARLAVDPALRARLGANGRKAFDAEFARGVALARWRQLVSALTPTAQSQGNPLKEIVS